MAEGGLGFADLVDENEHARAWQQQRLEALLFLRSLGEDQVFLALAGKLSDVLRVDGELLNEERCTELVDGIALQLCLAERGVEMLRKRVVQTIAVSGAVALVLSDSEPSFSLLSRLVPIEPLLEVTFIAERLAGSKGSEAWRSYLSKAQLNVSSINDDEYQAKDELERWGKELPRSVPSWRSGDFPHMGMAQERLLSGLLRVLDEQAWLSFLDRLPLPSTMEALLWYTGIERKPDQLLEWVRRAPLAFHPDGTRTHGALVFVVEHMALDRLENHIMRHSAWGNDAKAGREELSKYGTAIQDVVAAIKSRKDGDDLLGELSARCMTMAGGSEPDSSRTKLRYDLYFTIGQEYAKGLGDPTQVFSQLKRRELVDRSRSRWGLWLAAVAAALPPETEPWIGKRSSVLHDCWIWLVQLLRDRDAGIAERYGRPARWTAYCAACALTSLPNPLASLQKAWKELAGQRLDPQQDRYSGHAWATSRFLIDAAFSAYHIEENDEAGVEIWRTGMDMALTAWLSRSDTDPFAEVEFGLAHLAMGPRMVSNEPRRTFEYLLGLRQEATRAILMLVNKGMASEQILTATSGAGIDAGTYLALNGDERIKDAVGHATSQLGLLVRPETV